MSEFRPGLETGQLRQLVREVLAEFARPAAPPAGAPPAGTRPPIRPALNAPPGNAPPGNAPPGNAPPATAPPAGMPLATPPAPIAPPAAAPPAATPAELGSWSVRISSDDELHAFVLRVLRLADNPKIRRDLISGRSRFSLAGQPAAAAAQAVHRVERGAVTERTVATAAKAGARIVVGPRAVLTPLAKDKARALGVAIEKER